MWRLPARVVRKFLERVSLLGARHLEIKELPLMESASGIPKPKSAFTWLLTMYPY